MESLQPVNVSDLNEYLKNVMDADGNLKMLCIRGEIANYVAHQSGHSYFSLRDRRATVKCVLFKGYKRNLRFAPKNGMTALVIGDVSVFPRDGVYQVYVQRMYPEGMGEQQQELGALVDRLRAEGIFEKHRPLPQYPERVGIITSPTGAALQDIRNVIARRFPCAELWLFPTQVQGDAEDFIAAAIRKMDAAGPDVAILARGGGSNEDLSVFNSEAIARAIYACETPVISAIGHEIDVTVADFAADMRAPTPSAAAELAVPDVRDVLMAAGALEREMEERLLGRLQAAQETVVHRAEKIRLCAAARAAEYAAQLSGLRNGMEARISSVLSGAEQRLAAAAAGLDAASPLRTLARGYVAVRSERGFLRCSADVQPGEELELQFQDGRVRAVAQDICREETER